MDFDQAVFDQALTEERLELGLPPDGPEEPGLELAAGGRIINFDPGKHPRDPRGRFARVLGDLVDKSTKSDEVNLPGGTKITRGRMEGYVRVKEPDGRSVEHFAKADDDDDIASHEREIIARDVLDRDQKEEEKVWRDADLDELEENKGEKFPKGQRVSFNAGDGIKGKGTVEEIREKDGHKTYIIKTDVPTYGGDRIQIDPKEDKLSRTRDKEPSDQHRKDVVKAAKEGKSGPVLTPTGRKFGGRLKADASEKEISDALDGLKKKGDSFSIGHPDGGEDWVVTNIGNGEFEIDDHSGRPPREDRHGTMSWLSPSYANRPEKSSSPKVDQESELDELNDERRDRGEDPLTEADALDKGLINRPHPDLRTPEQRKFEHEQKQSKAVKAPEGASIEEKLGDLTTGKSVTLPNGTRVALEKNPGGSAAIRQGAAPAIFYVYRPGSDTGWMAGANYKEAAKVAAEYERDSKKAQDQRLSQEIVLENGFDEDAFQAALAEERTDRGLSIMDEARESAAVGRKRAQTARAKKADSQSSDPNFEGKHPRGFGGKFIRGGASNAPKPVLQGIKEKLGGELTEESIRDFQKEHGLQVDGVIGHQTASAILGNGKAKVGALTRHDKRRLFVTFKQA